ncbi:epididymal-specific lipocalin-9-like [Dipodomys merriami]|uniref:epididymal-specific lipocalin-9-like n=1 Tax=Dipodomys merriami TaxID=94247 RepID=UPI00384DCBB4
MQAQVDSRAGQQLLRTRSHWKTSLRPVAGQDPGAEMLRGAWLLVLSLGLGLARAQETLEDVPVQPGFDAHKVEGRWLTVQLASSRTDLVLPTDPLRLSLDSIRARENGDVEFLLFWKGKGLCTGLTTTVRPTGRPGRYRGTVPGSSLHVSFISTDYEHLILYARLEDGEATSLWALLARTLPADPKWLGQYLGYVEKFHLQEAPVSNMDGQCPPAGPRGGTPLQPQPLS